jgi:putative sigma-54 modulation protein
MKTNIRGEKIVVTKAIKSYIEDKIGKLNKYFENPDDICAHAVIKIKGHEQTIEVTIPTMNFTMRGEESNNDLYSAIDLVVEKLERQIRKNKTRLNKINKTKEFNFDYEENIEQEENKIVKRKMLETKPMSEEEAILQMNMLGHDFFIYKDSEGLNIKVIYKRKDGNYGVIETN